MYRDCSQCGESNKGERVDRGGLFREFRFECSCGVEGSKLTHKDAGVVSRRGSYFGVIDND